MKHYLVNRRGLRETVKMSWLLFYEQMYHIAKQPAALIVCLGLLLLPPLYAWFNIAASWDPYANTKNLKVGVVDLDKGVEIEGVKVDLGKNIVKNLRGNDKIGWQFVDFDSAMEKIHSGEYYAVLVIPKDFSKNITSFLRADVKKAEISYFVNEKLNAISPKVTGSGMNTLEEEINRTFIKEVSDIALNALRLADEKYKAYKPNLLRMFDTMDLTAANMRLFVSNMDDFEKSLDAADELIASAEKTLPLASESLQKASKLTLGAQDTLQSAKSTLYDTNRLIDQGMTSAHLLGKQIEKDGNDLKAISNEEGEVLEGRLQTMITKTEDLSAHIDNMSSTLAQFNKMLPKPLSGLNRMVSQLDEASASLKSEAQHLRDLKNDIKNGADNFEDILNDAQATSQQIGQMADELWETYQNGLSKDLDQTTNQMIASLDDTYDLLQSSAALIPQVNGVFGSLKGMKPVGQETLKNFKESIMKSQALLEKTTGDARELTEMDKFDKVINFIRQDIDKESDFLSQPVEVKTHRLYPVPNYGSGMSPFYSVLAIWVGSLLMMSMISPINKKGLEAYPKVGVTPMYLSRLGLFQTLALFQGLIVGLGDLLFLHVHCQHPMLFLLVCIACGQIFSIFIFSLVFAFGNIGKAVAVIVLVLQVAASGGTYPIEMTPVFFQKIHPWLPFTYCIGAVREVSSGIYWPALWSDIIMMSLLPIVSVTLVIIFAPKLRQTMKRFERSMKKSGLGE